MPDDNNPLIEFESGGKAPILSYNVPQPTTYDSRVYVEFDYPKGYFSESTKEIPKFTLEAAGQKFTEPKLKEKVDEFIDTGVLDEEVFGYLKSAPGFPDFQMLGGLAGERSGSARGIGTAVARDRITEVLADNPQIVETIASELDIELERFRSDGGQVQATQAAIAEDLVERIQDRDYLSTRSHKTSYLKNVTPLSGKMIMQGIQDGEYPLFRKNLYGDYVPVFYPEPEEPIPQLALVERYRISSFLGNYGAGRTIKTFTLFPGERTRISIKTYKNTERQRQEASSVLESATRESTHEFEQTFQSEMTFKTRLETEAEYSFGNSGEAGLTLPVEGIPIGIKLGGEQNVSGRVSAAHELVGKNATTAVDKHAQSSSSKREVQVNTSASFEERTGEETTIEREIENINVSRTLNLVFRQMNQEFITLFHLVDVRLAYTNGYPQNYQEVPLSKMDELLDRVLVSTASGTDVRSNVERDVLDSLRRIHDYQGSAQSDFVIQETRGDYTYRRVNSDKTMTYRDEATDTEITVPGIITSSTKNTLRTDGVIVEALLGKGEGLDTYSRELQTQAVRARSLENDLREAEIRRNDLAREIIDDNDSAAAELFGQVFPEPRSEETDEE